ncbi:MAG: hypothetical protein ABIQ52_07670 [Vicinamibacterales bacterium]
MADFPESKQCVECDGTMDRRHGTLPAERTANSVPADLRRIPNAQVAEIGTYYRCLKNGAHTVIVARDTKLPASPRH